MAHGDKSGKKSLKIIGYAALVIGATALFFGLFFLAFPAGIDLASAQSSKDTIAIRVIPNSSHHSAMRWYRTKEFSGSPQSLVVDGYDAVRDGRTVYVNAANVNLNHFYTNIYLISYNQDAEPATKDVFSRMLKHWRFNTNLVSAGHCRGENSIVCSRDKDCPIGDVCDNRKARVVRDTRRLADLAEIGYILDEYEKSAGYFPRLAAGTYLPHRSLSVWPSWRDAFSEEAGTILPVDPVNKLGSCPGYDENTCWNESSKSFAVVLSDLPDNSLVYQYFTDAAGSARHLCAVLESGFIIEGADLIDAACAEICLDFDGDGYGDPASATCPHSGLDCDDTNPASTVPTGAENCAGGVDEDCDGAIDCADADCAGSPACVFSSLCDGDGICEPVQGETCANCAGDGCCLAPACPDGFCDGISECLGSVSACPADCACGNSRRECLEACDDGNTVSGDGCSAACASEAPACVDRDGDGYGVCPDCGTASGCRFDGNDCDDDNVAGCGLDCHPGAAEVCDGYDNDCDGTADEGFNEESCGFLCLALNPTYDYNSLRIGNLRCCGDDALEGGPYSSAEDLAHCHDERDNDCDGYCDTVAGECSASSVPDPDCTGICSNLRENNHVGVTAGCNQCGNGTDEDGDETTACGNTMAEWNAAAPGMVDICDPDCLSGGISDICLSDYEANETLCDGLDNDCDGETDESLLPRACLLAAGVCAGSTQTCAGGSWTACGPADYGPNYEVSETRCDGLDNDCDGSTDESCTACYHDGDSDGFGDPADSVTASICPAGYVSDNTDCDDARNFIYPGRTESCDGFDNDCDSPPAIDEGCDDDSDDYCDSAFRFFNDPILVCPSTHLPNNSSGDDCDDTDPDINPGAAEVCDGANNDCNAATADGSGVAAPLNTLQAGICAGSYQSCAGGIWIDDYSGVAGYQITESSCIDAIDNDCDGIPDCDDADCAMSVDCGCRFTITFPCDFAGGSAPPSPSLPPSGPPLPPP